jgi:chromosome partitioning protein
MYVRYAKGERLRRIAIANQKGGTAKTTVAVNLAVGLGNLKKNVLLIDLDPQGNATSHLGIKASRGIAEYLSGGLQADDILFIGNELDVLPAGSGLTKLEEIWYKKTPASFENLKKNISVSGYDYVIIDCPPHLGVLTVAALVYSSEVLIPVRCDYFGLEGLSMIVNTLDQVRAGLNPDLKLLKVVPTFYDQRNTISDFVIDEIKEHFPKELSKTRIRVNVALAEAPAHGKDIFNYQPHSHGAEDFKALCREIERG